MSSPITRWVRNQLFVRLLIWERVICTPLVVFCIWWLFLALPCNTHTAVTSWPQVPVYCFPCVNFAYIMKSLGHWYFLLTELAGPARTCHSTLVCCVLIWAHSAIIFRCWPLCRHQYTININVVLLSRVFRAGPVATYPACVRPKHVCEAQFCQWRQQLLEEIETLVTPVSNKPRLRIFCVAQYCMRTWRKNTQSNGFVFGGLCHFLTICILNGLLFLLLIFSCEHGSSRHELYKISGYRGHVQSGQCLFSKCRVLQCLIACRPIQKFLSDRYYAPSRGECGIPKCWSTQCGPHRASMVAITASE